MPMMKKEMMRKRPDSNQIAVSLSGLRNPASAGNITMRIRVIGKNIFVNLNQELKTGSLVNKRREEGKNMEGENTIKNNAILSIIS